MILTLCLATPLNAAEITILALGDSLTEGYGNSKEEAYPALVEAALQQQGYPQVKVLNAGLSGSTSASAVSRLRWYLKVKPQILLLALGANDGLRGLDISQLKKNLGEAIEMARQRQMTVLLVGMKMPLNYGAEYTKSFEEAFPEVAKQYQVAFLPFLLEGVGGKPELNLPDGIHPNAAGHRIVAQTVVKHLLPLLAKSQ